MAVGTDQDGELGAFLAATEDKAQQVLNTEDGYPTYWAGIAFQDLAANAMAEIKTDDGYLAELPTAIFLVWAALTDEVDAPGRSAEQRAAGSPHMKRAAAEWLSVVSSPEDRTAYLDRWQYEECGYQRTTPARPKSRWRGR